jgi:predicted dinucleotide-binding enzyme
MMKFAVLGSGPVGQVLARGLAKHGYEVRIGSRSPEKLADFSDSTGIASATFEECAVWSDALVLAVAGRVAADVLALCGDDNIAGKPVIDATNPISDEPPTDGVLHFFTNPNHSLMEQLQEAFPKVRFVKAFSCVGNAYMVNPDLPGGPPTMFTCGDDSEAKAVVAELLAKFGWDVEDLGTCVAARAIEPLCQLWCIPGFRENRWSHAFRLLRG